eukprot:6387703-Prymnesium_polylepis.2
MNEYERRTLKYRTSRQSRKTIRDSALGAGLGRYNAPRAGARFNFQAEPGTRNDMGKRNPIRMRPGPRGKSECRVDRRPRRGR